MLSINEKVNDQLIYNHTGLFRRPCPPSQGLPPTPKGYGVTRRRDKTAGQAGIHVFSILRFSGSKKHLGSLNTVIL